MAGSLDKVTAKITGPSLTSTKSVATTDRITGWLERIDIKLGSITSKVDIAVLSSNELTGFTTTVLALEVSPTTIPTFSYVPRQDAQNTANGVGTNDTHRFMVLNETLYLTATNSTYSNQTVQAVIFYERP
jgi:hypothetical protein